MPDPSQPTATRSTRAESTSGNSAQAEEGGYWKILWDTQSPGEVLRRAVAEDLEEAKLETSTPLSPRHRSATLASSASIIRAVRRVDTGVTAIGQYLAPDTVQAGHYLSSISRCYFSSFQSPKGL